MKSTIKSNGSLKIVYILNIIAITAIVVLNGFIRSITIVQVQYANGEKVIVELKKYAEVFPLLTKVSIFIIFCLLMFSFVLTIKANNFNKKRLLELTRLFENVGLDKIDRSNSNLDKSDLVVIDAWNRSVEEVIQSNEKREKYFNQMIHDLNTPIQILKMNAKMNTLKNDKKYAIKIEEELEELESRISNFLHIEKISYFEKPEFKPVVMQSYLKQIENRFKVLSVNLIINYSDNNIVYITDRAMLDKILQNLLENAIKYGKKKTIFINVTNDKLEVINYVEEDVKIGNIFAKKQRSYSRNGNGLGAEIIKTYAELLNIKIESCNVDNKFIVTLEIKK